MFESVWISLLCGTLYGGAPEEVAYFNHDLENGGARSFIRADCVTPTHVIEFGRDTSSGLRDSITQAVFNADVMGRAPLVVIIDSDNHIGSREHQVLRAGERLGVRVDRISTEVALHSHYQALRAAAGS